MQHLAKWIMKCTGENADQRQKLRPSTSTPSLPGIASPVASRNTEHPFVIMIYDAWSGLVIRLATSPLCPADESRDHQALSLRLSSTVCLDASAPTYLVQGCNRSRVIEPPACKSVRAYLEDKQHG